jgi:hypothetical protein
MYLENALLAHAIMSTETSIQGASKAHKVLMHIKACPPRCKQQSRCPKYLSLVRALHFFQLCRRFPGLCVSSKHTNYMPYHMTGFVFWNASWQICNAVLRGSPNKPLGEISGLLVGTQTIGLCRYINLLHRCDGNPKGHVD